jgi:hypothetical protein
MAAGEAYPPPGCAQSVPGSRCSGDWRRTRRPRLMLRPGLGAAAAQEAERPA